MQTQDRKVQNRKVQDKKTQDMKILYAKNALLISFIFFGVPIILFVPMEIHALWEKDIVGSFLYGFWAAYTLFIYTFFVLRGHGTHWIKYGNGKVVVRRVSKECVNGSPKGKWKKREDTFLLEEIAQYGLSRQVLGYYVERHLCSSYRFPPLECFFRLKNGKIIGCEIGFYPRRRLKDFFQYLYETTGIALQKEKTP